MVSNFILNMSSDIKIYPAISIIVPNWNTKEHIIAFLDSVERQTYPKSAIEIVIVDNGSTDGSQSLIDSWISRKKEGWLGLKLIPLQTNQGIAAGYNIGYENCSDNAWAIMRGESDVELASECLERLVAVLKEQPKVGLVGAKGVVFDNPEEIDHAARYMNWWTGSLSDANPTERVDCDCVFGGTFLVRKSCLDKLGNFFSSRHFLASELELCTRVKRHGYQVTCEPDAVALHKIARSTHQLKNWKFGYISMFETIDFYLNYNRFPQLAVCLGLYFSRAFWRFLKGDLIPMKALRDSVFYNFFHVKVGFLKTLSSGKPAIISEWLSAPE